MMNSQDLPPEVSARRRRIATAQAFLIAYFSERDASAARGDGPSLPGFASPMGAQLDRAKLFGQHGQGGPWMAPARDDGRLWAVTRIGRHQADSNLLHTLERVWSALSALERRVQLLLQQGTYQDAAEALNASGQRTQLGQPYTTRTVNRVVTSAYRSIEAHPVFVLLRTGEA